MDINLTGSIVADLARPWWSPIITSSVGIIGALVGGVITLLGVKRTQKSNEIINEQNRKHEERSIRREERKSVYKNFHKFMEKMNIAFKQNTYKYPMNEFWDDFVTNMTEIELIDFEVATKIREVIPESKNSEEDLAETLEKVV